MEANRFLSVICFAFDSVYKDIILSTQAWLSTYPRFQKWGDGQFSVFGWSMVFKRHIPVPSFQGNFADTVLIHTGIKIIFLLFPKLNYVTNRNIMLQTWMWRNISRVNHILVCQISPQQATNSRAKFLTSYFKIIPTRCVLAIFQVLLHWVHWQTWS